MSDATTSLHCKPTAPDAAGFIQRVTPQSAGWQYVGFEAAQLKAGANLAVDSDSTTELCVVILSGIVSLQCDGQRFPQVGKRMSVFEGTAPYAAETQTVVQRGKAVGCKVLLISDSRVSPLYQLADHTLLVREAELHAFRSLSASMSLVQALVLGLIHDHLRHDQTNTQNVKPEQPNV